MPAQTGNGLAMRASVTLEALAARFAVHLLVVPVGGPATEISDFVRRHTSSVIVEELGADPLAPALLTEDPARVVARLIAWPTPMLCRFANTELRRRIAAHVATIAPALIHVMRLYLVPYVETALAASDVPAVLDLDDDDVHTHKQLSQIHAMRGDSLAVAVQAREAERFHAIEGHRTNRFSRLLVASEADRVRLAPRLGSDLLTVFPNAIRVPKLPDPPTTRVLLFVGTLGYAPNEDAALVLLEEVLPRLRAAGEDPVLRIVGAGASERLRRSASAQRTELVGYVDDISAEYVSAGLVPIPLRAGGGTRIKLLEALAHGRPVVTTTIGAEGIAVEHDRHLLIADEPAAFADACLALLRDPPRARQLAAAGWAYVRQHHDQQQVGATLASLYTTLAGTSDAHSGDTQ